MEGLEGLQESVERAKIVRIYDALLSLPKSRVYRVLVRTDGWRPVGLITKREFLPDTSLGKGRDWVSVLPFDGSDIIRELLDMVDKRSGDLVSCIVAENSFFIFTARKTVDNSNEPDNFQWVVSPDQMNAFHELSELMHTKDQMLMSSKENIDSLTSQKEKWRHDAEIFGNENRNLKDRNVRLSEQVSLLNQQVAQMQTMVHLSREMQIEIIAELQQKLLHAADTGRLKALSPEQLVDEAIERDAKRAEKMSSFVPQTELFKQIKELQNKIAVLEGSASKPSGGVVSKGEGEQAKE